MLKPHIVIIGAGFGGTYVGKKLAKLCRRGEIDLTIVNRTNYFLFTPLLHEVATGSLSPRSVAEPLREIFRGTGAGIAMGEAVSIDRKARTVEVVDKDERAIIEYDYLVISTGTESNYYGIPGAKEYTMPLKDLDDAVTIRNQVIEYFELAALEADMAKRKAMLSFAVVGGGPTGVEVAAELAEFIHGMEERYYGSRGAASVSLIHAGKELLEQFHPKLRQAASARLQNDDITIETGVTVASVSRHGLATKDGRMIPASLTIWAAGVKPIIPRFQGEELSLIAGRLPVDEHFNLKAADGPDDRIFVLGDASGYIDPAEAGPDPAKPRPLPQLAQVATQQSKIVAMNVCAAMAGGRLKAFRYKSKGGMVSVGQWFAIGEIYSLNIAGRLTWWLWRTIYLFKFASWRRRIRIAFEWAFELISPRDITQVVR